MSTCHYTMNPVSSRQTRKAAQMPAAWAITKRRQRRQGARWWWRCCQRTASNWQEQWQLINANNGIVSL